MEASDPGGLALRGRIGLFQDEIGGERLPLPYYVIGLSQLVARPSLLAARVTSPGFGDPALAFTFLAARPASGNGADLLAAACLATHSVVVGYYAAASYFGLCAALVAVGVADRVQPRQSAVPARPARHHLGLVPRESLDAPEDLPKEANLRPVGARSTAHARSAARSGLEEPLLEARHWHLT